MGTCSDLCLVSHYRCSNNNSGNKKTGTSPHLVNRKLLGIPLTNSLLAHVDDRHLDVGTHQSHNGARRATNIPSADAANLLDRDSRKIRETVRVAVLHVN